MPTVSEVDARARAVRTAIQVIAVDLAVVVLPLIIDVLDGELSVSELWRSGARAVLAAGLAYAMRRRAIGPGMKPGFTGL